MNLFITLLENVNKSRTSANNVSLKVVRVAAFSSHFVNVLDENPSLLPCRLDVFDSCL
jgi:hypothetical protein